MGRARLDLTGKEFGLLTAREVVSVDPHTGSVVWRCDCRCGRTVEVTAAALRHRSGVRSCGCAAVKRGRHAGSKMFKFGRAIEWERRRHAGEKLKDIAASSGVKIPVVCTAARNLREYRKLGLIPENLAS
jgi:hypothetical protein